MKLLTYEYEGAQYLGVLAGDEVLDIAAIAKAQGQGSPTFSSLLALIHAGREALSVVRRLLASEPGKSMRLSLGSVKFLAPIARPQKNIFCVGRNYVDHVTEGYRAQGKDIALPQHIQLFSKPPTTVTGPGAGIRHDAQLSDKMDYEVELAVIIGKSGRNISPANAMEHVFGYTIINDITARDLQRRHDQWFKGKGLDTSCPMGPWVVTADEIADPQKLAISLRINGEIRQSASTAQMIFKLPQIISDLSHGLTLEAGDVIATGTPSGVGYAMDPPRFLQPGDVVECEIEGIGLLQNVVVTAVD